MKNYVIDLLIDELENYKDCSMYGCDMAYTLLESYNIDGSITYNAYEAMEWIKTYFNEINEVLENMAYEFDNDYMLNIYKSTWENPEAFMVIIVLENASKIIGQLDFINDKWDDKIVLNDENIKIIKEQLENEKEEVF